MKPNPILVTLCLCAFGTAPAFYGAQGNRPSFEVASVKPNDSGDMSTRIGIRPGGRLIATNATLKSLMLTAYQVQNFQISGGPGWIDSAHFDINAVASENAGREQVNLMLQSLLEERFKLKIHHAPKESDVFVLRIAKNGPKIKPVEDNPEADHGVKMDLHRVYTDKIAPMPSIVSLLQNVVNRTVVDGTGLSGAYSFELQWGKTPAGDEGPSFFTAIEEQLGLRLDSERQQIDTIVIDSAEKPNGN